MESTLNGQTTLEVKQPPRLRIAAARFLQVVGWNGVAGLLLLVASLAIGRDAWLARAELRALAAQRDAPLRTAPAQVLSSAPVTSFALPRRDDLGVLLMRIERAATDNGLPWTQATYRIVPPTQNQAGSAEVRCAFKAPYPKVRAMLAAWLADVPALTFRELSFSRADAATELVDTKITIAIYLDDEIGARDARDASPKAKP